jgi:hypothetical protein
VSVTLPPPARRVVFCVYLSLFVGTAALFASGYSTITIIITPIAAGNDGIVVFKTYSDINSVGSHSRIAGEYGWLCASSDGLWKERLHAREADASSAFENLYAEFERRVDLSDPPESLSDLLEECGVAEARALSPEEGKGRAIWTPERFCLDERCSIGDIQQRSLGGLLSAQHQGTAVESVFFFEGLALFENLRHFDPGDLPKPIGAEFPFGNPFSAVGFDVATISGIITFDLSHLAPPLAVGYYLGARSATQCLTPEQMEEALQRELARLSTIRGLVIETFVSGHLHSDLAARAHVLPEQCVPADTAAFFHNNPWAGLDVWTRTESSVCRACSCFAPLFHCLRVVQDKLTVETMKQLNFGLASEHHQRVR